MPSAVRAPLPLAVVAALFAAVIIWVLAASLAPRRIPTFVPEPRRPPPGGDVVADTVTIDARDADRWRFFDFTRGPLEDADTAGWDLAFRRFHAIAAGAVAGVERVPFDSLGAAPDTGYAATRFGRDTLSPALARWYRYSYLSHLLQPRRRVYVVRTQDRRYAKLEFLGYYCPGPSPGCVTFRYLYRADGDTRLR